ncbi:MAG: hypothetical protein ACI4AN_02390 [Muribaculaceae bacterium]
MLPVFTISSSPTLSSLCSLKAVTKMAGMRNIESSSVICDTSNLIMVFCN